MLLKLDVTAIVALKVTYELDFYTKLAGEN